MAQISSFCVVILSLILVLNIPEIASDHVCLARSGTCQYDGIWCSGGYISGLCSGGASRRCCAARENGPGDDGCANIGGLCQNDAWYCSGGYQSYLCAGDSNRRCCKNYFGK